MLHAARLTLPHPISGERLVLESPLPPDFAGLLRLARSSAR
jgi:23S rRNA pseudouridine1911/1915/1917 synthase